MPLLRNLTVTNFLNIIGARNLLEISKIRNCAGQLKFPIFSRWHCQIDAEKAGRENQKHAQSSREFPPSQRKLALQFRSHWLFARRRVLHILLVPHPPAIYHNIPRRRHQELVRCEDLNLDCRQPAPSTSFVSLQLILTSQCRI